MRVALDPGALKIFLPAADMICSFANAPPASRVSTHSLAPRAVGRSYRTGVCALMVPRGGYSAD